MLETEGDTTANGKDRTAIKPKAEEDEMNEMSLDDLRVTEAACEDEQAYWDEELRELCDWMMNGDDED